jgi:hypothetical protein
VGAYAPARMPRKDIERRARYAPAWAGTVRDLAGVAQTAMDEMVAGGVPQPNLDIAVETWDGPLQQEFVASAVDEFVLKASADSGHDHGLGLVPARTDRVGGPEHPCDVQPHRFSASHH